MNAQRDIVPARIARSVVVILSLIGVLVAGVPRLQAQVGDPAGVSVNIKIYNVVWNTIYSNPGLYAAITDLSGATQSTPNIAPGVTQTQQLVARLAVGVTYNLNIVATGVDQAVALVVPPAGYVMEIGYANLPLVPHEQIAFSGSPSLQIRVRPPAGMAPPRAGVSTALGTQRTLWQLSLGSLSNGEPAGVLGFIDTSGGATVGSLFSPAGLYYDWGSSDVLVMRNPANATAPYIPNTIHYIIAPEVCVDVYMDNAYQCQLKIYHRAQLTVSSSGGYLFTGDPFAWYFFNPNGANVNSVEISCCLRNITGMSGGQPSLLGSGQSVVRTKITTLQRVGTSPDFTWTAQDWFDQGGSTLSQEVRSRSGNSETVAIAVPGQSPAIQFGRSYSAVAWGEVVNTETLGSFQAVVTSYDFNSSSDPQSAAYARLKSRNTSGQWEAYEYNDYASGASVAGSLYRRHRPYAPSQTSVDLSGSGEVTTYAYAADAYGRAVRPTQILTMVGGINTAQTSISYSENTANFSGHSDLTFVTATRNDYVSSGSSLTTVTKYFREDAGDPDRYPSLAADDFFRGRIHSIQRPDGVKQSFVYQRGVWNGTSFTVSGNNGLDAISGSYATQTAVITGSATSGASYCSSYNGYSIDPLWLVVDTLSDPAVAKYKSTLEVTIRDAYARVIRIEKSVWAGASGWQLVQALNYQWNFSNQLVQRAINQSVSYNLSAGAIYTASYDGERLTSEIGETGVSLSYTYDSSDRVDTATQAAAGIVSARITKYGYDAADHLTAQKVGWTQSDQISTYWNFDDAGRLSSQQSPGPNGAMTTSYAYNPSSRQVTTTFPNLGTRIETYQPNSALQSVTGTSTLAGYYTYQVQTDGTRYTRLNIGTGTSLRLQESWRDWLGRTRKTSRPGFGGTSQPAFVEQTYFDATSGMVTRTSRSDSNGAQLYADMLYGPVSNVLTQPTYRVLDITSNGAIDLSSDDRVDESDRYFESYNGGWWLTTVTRTYPNSGTSTSLTVSLARERLTGFSGNTLAETRVTDVDGNVTTRSVAVARGSTVLTVSATSSGYANTRTETIVNGLTTSVTEFDGLSYGTGYDGLYRPNTSVDPRAGTTTTYYKPGSSFVWKVRDPAGNYVSTYGYDNAGRVTSVMDAANHVAYTEYNTRDQIVHRWGDVGYPVEYGYDSNFGDRTLLKTYRGGSNWAAANWPASTAGVADITSWIFDPASGLLASKVDASGQSVSYGYNARGQVSQRTWARSVTTTYNYYGDINGEAKTGELHTLSYSDGTPAVTYAYRRTGQLFTVGDVTGTRTFGYNSTYPLQLDSVAFGSFYNATDGTSRVLARRYDSIHRPVGFYLGTAATPGADLTQGYVYNGLGRFDHFDTAVGVQGSRTFTYAYNSGGLVNGITVSGSSFSVSYDFEPNRDLRTKVDSLWGTTSRTRYDYVYSALGERYTAKQSGDVFSDFGSSTYYRHVYNGRGELESSAGYFGETPIPLNGDPNDPAYVNAQLPGRNFRYTYDTAGNRATAGRSGPAGTLDHYTSNALNQYASRENNVAYVAGTAQIASSIAVTGGAANSGVGRQGRYWNAQAALNNTSGPASAILTVAATLSGAGTGGANLVRTETRMAYLAAALQSFTYDADGNMTSDGVWNYAYDGENRLKSMSASPEATRVGFPDRLLEFKYDYLGRRVQKRSVNQTAVTETWTRYLYDGDNLVAEFNAPNGTNCGNMLRSYAWGLDLAGSLTVAAGVGGLVQITDHATGTAYFPTYDGNGNIASLLRASDGQLVATYEYSPFGEMIRCQEPTSGGFARKNPFRFSTKYTDDESDLIFFGGRYFSPSLGRFINRDPIEEGGGLNLYGFCGNNAVNRHDHLGFGEDFWWLYWSWGWDWGWDWNWDDEITPSSEPSPVPTTVKGTPPSTAIPNTAGRLAQSTKDDDALPAGLRNMEFGQANIVIPMHTCMECHGLDWRDRKAKGLPFEQPWFNAEGTAEAYNEMAFWIEMGLTALLPTLAEEESITARANPNPRQAVAPGLAKREITAASQVAAGEGRVTQIEQQQPTLVQQMGPAPGPSENSGSLVRFGKGPETAEQLAEQAAKAEANEFPHGVSTRLKDRISGSDKSHRSATKSEVEKIFEVKQTGEDPRHYTVILPKPVTPETATQFNNVFSPKN